MRTLINAYAELNIDWAGIDLDIRLFIERALGPSKRETFLEHLWNAWHPPAGPERFQIIADSKLALERLRVKLNPNPKLNFIEQCATNAFKAQAEFAQKVAASKERTRQRRLLNAQKQTNTLVEAVASADDDRRISLPA